MAAAAGAVVPGGADTAGAAPGGTGAAPASALTHSATGTPTARTAPADPAAPPAAADLPWPARRFAACGAFDPTDGQLVAFGGRSEGGSRHLGDAWALQAPRDGRPRWRLVAPAEAPGAPPPVRSCAAAYDSTADRLLVFGGWDGTTMRNGVWALDLGGRGAWTQLCDAASCGPAPSPRRAAQASYDPVRRRLVVIGGTDGAYRNDVWALSLAGADAPRWQRLSPAGAAPVPRAAHGQVYDAARDRIWVVGGTTSGRDLDDVWALDLAEPAWHPAAPACEPDCPSARSGHVLVHDTAGDRLVLFGGAEGGTTTAYPGGAWALAGLGAGPGGSDGDDGDDGGRPAWRRLALASEEPDGRSAPVAGYDPAGARALVFGGGQGATAFKDSMALHLPAGEAPFWRGVAPVTPLTARDQAAVVMRSATGEAYAFGGFGSGTLPGAVDAGAHLADTWVLTDPAEPGRAARWRDATPRDPAAIPLSREAAAVAPEPGGRRAFVVGGLTGNRSLADVWMMTTGRGTVRWQQLCSPTSCGRGPVGRWAAHAVYDPAGRQVVVFGGRAPDGDTLGDTWALRLDPRPHWVELATDGPRPPRRWSGAAAYDPARRRMVVWGGQQSPDAGGVPLADTWALALGGAAGAWSELHPSGTPPEGRRSPAVAAVPRPRRPAGEGRAGADDADGRGASGGGGGGREAASVGRPAVDMLVTTGYTPTNGAHHNDVWRLRLDTTDGAWEQLAPDDCGRETAPACRRSASAVWDPDARRLVVLFGRDADGFLSDGAAFDPGTGRWSALDPPG